MNCEKYSVLIEDLIEGELDARSAEPTASHVLGCPKCAAEFASLRREKEIYARFLFDAEPPADLWANFQTRLAAEKEKTVVAAQAPSVFWRRPITGIFGFPRFSRAFGSALATAAVVLFLWVIGLVWLKNPPIETSEGNGRYGAKTRTGDSPQPSQSVSVVDRVPSASDLPVKSAVVSFGNEIVRKNNEPIARNRFVKNQPLVPKRAAPDAGKALAAEKSKNNHKAVVARKKKSLSPETQFDEAERDRSSRMKNLENEIAGQIEKIEMLLRSFRNARMLESGATFDVEYERLQSRRLLERNALLKSAAENYGIFYAEELLSRAETLLLDIANLEPTPATDKVLNIKQRVGNQNIIASLQVY